MISWEQPAKKLLQPFLRWRLRDRESRNRFDTLRFRYRELYDSLLGDASASPVRTEGYEWDVWSEDVRRTFTTSVPPGFLHQPTLAQTMVFSRKQGFTMTQRLVQQVENAFGASAAKKLLPEDYIGLPVITNLRYRTSAQRAYHASHLSAYTNATQKKFWENACIAEWGGGYGNMARIIRKMNPSVTYILIDLPELLALQYIYLASLEGEDQVHVILPSSDVSVVKGLINLVPAHHLLAQRGDRISCDGFVSTWAVTESPKESQEFVLGRRFFGAANILIASICDRNNFMQKATADMGLQRLPVPVLAGSGNHEYWFGHSSVLP